MTSSNEASFDNVLVTPQKYRAQLQAFDSAICEALAVGQGIAHRLPPAHIGWASYIFSRLCAHGVLMIRAAPQTRWVESQFDDWNFASVASHARAIMEGVLFFNYLIDEPESEAELAARLNVMFLNDCTKRAEVRRNLGADEAELGGFFAQQDELKKLLRANVYFSSLNPAVQKSCLTGTKTWIKSREQLITSTGMDLQDFNGLWTLLSQHTHILPLSFIRMEPDGRGSGLENEVDRGYIGIALDVCASLIGLATLRMVEAFPDVGHLRRGLDSRFSPGPASNDPIPDHADSSLLSVAISEALGTHGKRPA